MRSKLTFQMTMMMNYLLFIILCVCVCLFLSSKNRFEELIQLFNRYQKLCDIVKEKAGKGRASSKAPRSLLSLGFISALLYALFR